MIFVYLIKHNLCNVRKSAPINTRLGIRLVALWHRLLLFSKLFWIPTSNANLQENGFISCKINSIDRSRERERELKTAIFCISLVVDWWMVLKHSHLQSTRGRNDSEVYFTVLWINQFIMFVIFLKLWPHLHWLKVISGWLRIMVMRPSWGYNFYPWTVYFNTSISNSVLLIYNKQITHIRCAIRSISA